MEMSRRKFVAVAGGCAALGLKGLFLGAAEDEREVERAVTLCICGATPGGLAAAISAARHGSTVVVVEPAGQIGGLLTSGLSWSDFRTFESLSGVFQDFADRVEQYYVERYGADSEQVTACFRGTHGEPHVNKRVLEEMLSEHNGIRVVLQHTLADVELSDLSGLERIERVIFTPNTGGGTLKIEAHMFIDATYEGDLLAQAGVDYHVGREGRQQFGESLAGDEQGRADAQVQGYNYRYVLTDMPENRVMCQQPAGYDREDFVGVLQHLGPGGIEETISGGHRGIFRTHLPLLPNRKADVNDTPHAPVRLSMPDINDEYPDGDPATRLRIVGQHGYYHQGLLYFIQNDDQVPKAVQRQARQWGFCKDEFAENNHLPPLLYIREARRMIGQHVFTEHDTQAVEGDIRSPLQRTSIGIGDYTLNCHGTGREGSRYEGRHVGEFYKSTAPFQLPFGMLISTTHANLLVPVACSASHVGFSAIRLEPTWAALGQAAGLAAHLAANKGVPVQEVDVEKLQELLNGDGAKTIYVTDVEPDDPEFAAVQYFGVRGAFHGLRNPAEQDPPQAELIYGQYIKARPWHEAELEKPITASLAQRWLALVSSAVTVPAELNSDRAADSLVTRGAFLKRLYEAIK